MKTNSNPREWRYMKGLVAFGLIGMLEACSEPTDTEKKEVRKAS